MKLISLNTWGGRVGVSQFFSFIKEHEDTDIFCFQEMWNGGEHMLEESAAGVEFTGVIPDLFTRLQRALPSHTAYFRPNFSDHYGLAIFIKSSLKVIEEGELFVYQERGYVGKEDIADHARNMQYITFETQEGLRTVLHTHGLWNGNGKGDSDDRIQQSANIISFVSTLKNPFVLTGDFNLHPDTKSVKMLEEAGMRNLITENGVTTTRTSLYTKNEKFADFTFTSKGIEVKHFAVLPDEVSDHSVLALEFI